MSRIKFKITCYQEPRKYQIEWVETNTEMIEMLELSDEDFKAANENVSKNNCLLKFFLKNRKS